MSSTNVLYKNFIVPENRKEYSELSSREVFRKIRVYYTYKNIADRQPIDIVTVVLDNQIVEKI